MPTRAGGATEATRSCSRARARVAARSTTERPSPSSGSSRAPFGSCVDTRAHRLVFARWWFNPWVSARTHGLTRDPAAALTPDSVNVWQVVSAALVRDPHLAPALVGVRLAAGGVVPRRRGMG